MADRQEPSNHDISFLGENFEVQRISDIPVNINSRLDVAGSTHLHPYLKKWVADDDVFKEPGESIDSLRQILERIGPIDKVVTVVGSEWPLIWHNFGVKEVMGIDINRAQIEEYATKLTSQDMINKHKSGDCPLIVDDITNLDINTTKQVLPGRSVFISNLAEYQPTDNDFYNTLKKLAGSMTPGTHIILSSTTHPAETNLVQKPEQVKKWVHSLSQDLGKPIKLRMNEELGLPEAKGGGLLDSFFVISF